jgi:hypothetical protein
MLIIVFVTRSMKLIFNECCLEEVRSALSRLHINNYPATALQIVCKFNTKLDCQQIESENATFFQVYV